MGTVRITDPQGRSYEISAPDGASDAEILDYFRKNVGDGQSGTASPPLASAYHSGLSRPEIAEYENRRKDPGGMYHRRLNQAVTLGGGDEFTSGMNALWDTIRGDNTRGSSFGERFASRQRVQEALNKEMRDQTAGFGGGILDVVGGLAMGAPKAAATAIGNVAGPATPGAWNAVKQFTPEFIKQAPQIAKVGAGYGAAHAFMDSEGDASDRLAHVPGGAVDGAKGALVFGAGLGTALAAKQGRAVAKAERVAAQQDNAREMTDVGVTPFAPAITQNRFARGMAEGLADSIVGAPVRRGAQQSIDETSDAFRAMLRPHTFGQASSELGDELQGILQKQLRSRTVDDWKTATDADLERTVGPVTEHGFRPPRPIVEPVAPRTVDPVVPDYTRYPPQNEPAPNIAVEAKYPRFEDMPDRSAAKIAELTHRAEVHGAEGRRLSADIAKAEQDIMRLRREVVDKFKDDPTDVYGDLPLVYGGSVNKFRGLLGKRSEIFSKIKDPTIWHDGFDPLASDHGWNPRAVAALPPEYVQRFNKAHADLDALNQKRTTHAEAARAADEQRRTLAETSESDRLLDWKAAVTRERTRAELEARRAVEDSQKDSARRRADAEAAAETQRLVERARRDADAQTRAAQEAADLEWQNRPNAMQFGTSRTHTYPDEAAAAYEAVDRATPRFQTNVLGRPATSKLGAAETATSHLLSDLADKARIQYHHKGYRGAVYDNGSYRFDPQFFAHLRTLYGPKISDHLASYANMRAGGAAQFDIRRMHAFRTVIGQELQDVRLAKKIGAPRTEDEVQLDRLYKAVSEDIDAAKRAVPGGARAADMRKAVDDAYADHKTVVEKPLLRVFGEKVAPIEAMERLGTAVERGDLRTVNAFMRVLKDKDDPIKGAMAIVAHMTENARDLGSIMKGLAKIPPESRAVLFQTPAGREYRTALEKIERVAQKLRPYQKAIETSGKGFGVANTILGTSIIGHAIHALAAPMTTASGAGGAYLLGRFLASPRYVQWLTKTPSVSALRGSNPLFQKTIARLSAVAAADSETGDAILSAIGNAIRPGSANAMFAGESAATADRKMLAKAQEMENNGADRDAIWKTTGWFKQPDGRWRYEISDDKANTTPMFDATHAVSRQKRSMHQTQMKNLLQHDRLYDAYPDIGSMPVTMHNFGPKLEAAAYYLPGDDETVLNTHPKNGAGRNEVLHEIQHAIQKREGFRYGDLRAGKVVFDDTYYRKPGEAEAYNVDDRANMTAEERWATPPWQTGRVAERDIEWGSTHAKSMSVEDRKKRRNSHRNR
jgi:hypothetical protein